MENDEKFGFDLKKSNFELPSLFFRNDFGASIVNALSVYLFNNQVDSTWNDVLSAVLYLVKFTLPPSHAISILGYPNFFGCGVKYRYAESALTFAPRLREVARMSIWRWYASGF